MRIEPTGVPATPIRSSAPAPKAQEAGGEALSLTKTAFAPTGRLASLLAQVRGEPEVRSDAVREATDKLASGELDTPEAALDAARGMLDSLDSQ